MIILSFKIVEDKSINLKNRIIIKRFLLIVFDLYLIISLNILMSIILTDKWNNIKIILTMKEIVRIFN